MIVKPVERPKLEPIPISLRQLPAKARPLPLRPLTAREWEKTATDNAVALNACVDQLGSLVEFVVRRDAAVEGRR